MVARMRRMFNLRAVAVMVGLGLLAGCVSVPKRNPIPEDLITDTQVPGIPRAKLWGDVAPDWAEAWFAMSEEQLRAEHGGVFGREHHYLAISGGGAKGAFGAGLLCGWTASGNRPEFALVTGISTGALTAPWAFLGPDYDHVLEEIFTTYSTDDFINRRNLINILTSDAAASTKKLGDKLAIYLDEEVMADIAKEFKKGRGLYIGTTSLDAQRPVIWNIGRIAASGEPFALDLVRQIIMASASIPGAFPPVPIDVEAADGQIYDELHVDGGASSQVFLYPAGIDWSRLLKTLQVPGTPRVYVIRNSRLDPEAAQINRKIIPITGRTIASLIRTQGIGDLFRIYALTERDGLDFNLAHIPAEFNEKPAEQFDPAWMRKLFDLAFDMGQAGYEWEKTPPNF